MSALESELEGRPKDLEVIEEAINKCLPGFKVSDFRYGADYLNQVAKVMLKRILLQGTTEVSV